MQLATEVSMTESEDTRGDSSSSSGDSSTAPRPRSTRARKTATGTTRKKTGAHKTARTGPKRTATTGSRKAAPRRRRRATKTVGLQTFLNDLAKRANRAGSTIADLSEKGADAARGTIGKVSKSSRQTIGRVRKEWDKLDSTRKAQFVAGLLGALAATAAGVAKASRRK
jgi:hypothetical protein